MLLNRRITVILSLVVIVMVAVAATTPPPQHKRNLKVLPKDISHEELEKVMDGFKAALGVKCNYCHAASKTDPKKLDFASDEKPEKEDSTRRTHGRPSDHRKAGHYQGNADIIAPDIVQPY